MADKWAVVGDQMGANTQRQVAADAVAGGLVVVDLVVGDLVVEGASVAGHTRSVAEVVEDAAEWGVVWAAEVDQAEDIPDRRVVVVEAESVEDHKTDPEL